VNVIVQGWRYRDEIAFVIEPVVDHALGEVMFAPELLQRVAPERRGGGVKKSRVWVGRARFGASRSTASPSPQTVASKVLPVAAKSDFPLPLTPPCAQMPPRCAAVEKLTALPGRLSEKPTTNP
jgi:hypothetical protein